ncbi:MAG: energy transducer TonB [Gemmatimonas sp.]
MRRFVIETTAVPILLLPTIAIAQPTSPTNTRRDSMMTPTGWCHLWEAPPGSPRFPQDYSYGLCALDKRPMLIGQPAAPGPPSRSRGISANYQVTVNADGRVDTALTRSRSSNGDMEFGTALVDSLAHWRFQPGVRNGVAVRTTFQLEVRNVKPGEDKIPSHLSWAYKAGTSEDTLIATWIAESPLPAYETSQSDSIYSSVLFRLMAMHVLLPELDRQYCLVFPSADSVTQARLTQHLSRILRPGEQANVITGRGPPYEFAPLGCEKSVSALRVILPRLIRTENGRVVFSPSGDYLPNYPIGVNGRSWKGWGARCVANVKADKSVSADCDISIDDPEYPAYAMQSVLAMRRKAAAAESGAAVGKDSIPITAVVTTSLAFQNDTLHAATVNIPDIRQNALTDSLMPCGGYAAFTQQDSAELIVIHGDLTARELNVALAQRKPVRTLFRSTSCAAQSASPAKFAAFFIGGLGDRVTAPVTLVYSNEAKPFILDPARHTLAAKPHLTFRVSELRADTRIGGAVIMRLRIPPEESRNVIPIVIMQSSSGDWRYATAVLRPVSAGVWDFRSRGGYSNDATVSVYLIRRN